ncbi:nicotinate-nucleotide pyrophosphorylase [Chloroherpeton thalassium ATCC 35110]|uniref:Probable nicotinate-nucleotide pyrophosphorylase [carboxylating] n=1 Tax=Chloroherpeton thalassium (strain ATCC 35110 / GB-78) TaxID=517418 RepID=B3QTI0_CHLT3|nr:carboxylating nicotinate-nucleotide diphosphorylase [Chloroherpeton thalassium]ACF12726.1 nicotinate-nucleotide pyrophosphorylase [Chloroherpeton thalassium ATCC 35110]
MKNTNDIHLFKEDCEQKAIELALEEDIFTGDITTDAIIEKSHQSKGIIKVKTDGVIAGIKVAEMIFERAGEPVKFVQYKIDGDIVYAGDVVAEVTASTSLLLRYERTVLNFMQRMSGIATTTRLFVERVHHTSANILDTRKTAPGLRFFDKEAVMLGGGGNHRVGLYDRILIKDNHVDAAGGIGEAIQRAYNYRETHDLQVQIEVEVRSLEELQEALAFKPDIILLDNFSLGELREAVHIVKSQGENVMTEASGNVTLETARSIAETGVDYISVGALTHSVIAMDISMKIKALDS